MLGQAAFRHPAVFLVAAVLAEATLTFFKPQLGIAAFLTVCWYMLLSGADWALHRYVLHANDSPVPAWRSAHRTHHLEFDGLVGRTHASLTFAHEDTAFIALATSPLTVLIWLIARFTLTNSPPFWAFALAHAAMIVLGVGVHNYAHSVFHGYEPPTWDEAPRIKVPTAVCELLHEHHRKHHLDPGLNYCTVFLGFDWLAGSEASSVDMGVAPHRMFSHVGPHAGAPVQTKAAAAGLTGARVAEGVTLRPAAAAAGQTREADEREASPKTVFTLRGI